MGRRLFTPGRWNWSEKAKKWVFVEITKDGKRKYQYKVEPPPEFIELAKKMKNLNDKLLETADPKENMKIFNELINISQKMQEMGKLD
jgi:hypothetical protein